MGLSSLEKPMNEIERALRSPLVSAKDSGYTRHPYIHTDLHRAPITFLWWASTPSGRESKFFHAETFYRLRSSCKLGRDQGGNLIPVYVPSEHYNKSDLELRNRLIERGPYLRKKLPSGYVWHGPFLWSVLRPPQHEGAGFAFREPDHSEGIPMRYDTPQTSWAQQLARKVLSEMRVPA
jgi:hypothetical protein